MLNRWLTEWNDPEEWVVAENGDQVGAKAQIVGHLHMEGIVFFITLLTELDCGELARDQVEVERHEGSDDEG